MGEFVGTPTDWVGEESGDLDVDGLQDSRKERDVLNDALGDPLPENVLQDLEHDGLNVTVPHALRLEETETHTVVVEEMEEEPLNEANEPRAVTDSEDLTLAERFPVDDPYPTPPLREFD